jgi:hypothetical protein
MAATNNNTDAEHRPDPTLSIQNRLRLTARVAVGVSLLGSIVLLVTLFLLLRDQPDSNYYQIIQSLTRSQEHLALAMLIAGTLTVLLAGLFTWSITLYSSHRVAGPLYRFSRNLELEIEQGPVATTNLRKDDGFQDLSKKLAQAAEGLSQYYDDQRQLVDELAQNLDSEQRFDPDRCRYLLKKLAKTANASS